ncbi:pyrimidine reductase family protein [Iamia sp. SCSIO 61187]|uniref:dihydrofolate reductase family protein n=1 Tax=Iamia sp. SCSIO 61187 TaxID=2722752 RepID=UPI001C62BAF7|nr:dihydrofolate reductase family protein [Iamia sp. SCSIO 61187]QYG92687.1 pyrimidine reductase family protein [Iamia sp. SCSIO 61187]
MRQLLPEPRDEVDVAAAYAVDRPAHDGRPWVVALMASTADGAAAVEGRSGAIGGPGDSEVFAAVRAVADAVVVGAGTVAAERYGPVRLPDDVVARRHGRGQASQPQLAVVSGRLSLDPDLPLLAPGPAADRPLLIHPPAAPADRRAVLASRAELVEAAAGPGGGVDPSALLAELHRRGHRVVVLEGGPTLNGTMVAADLVDELCLTLDPMVVGGLAPRIVVGAGPGAARAWCPAHLLEHDGALFWRLLRDRSEA